LFVAHERTESGPCGAAEGVAERACEAFFEGCADGAEDCA
jgi:hypothetical protein